MLPRYQRYDEGTFLVYVDSYDNSVPTGKVYSMARGEVTRFNSLVQLLMKIEDIMNVENVPQSFQTVRTFFPLTGYIPDEEGELAPVEGKVATFSVQIRYRRNASWQGTVSWLDGKQTCNFRSVMELITLMNSAIESKKMTAMEEQESYGAARQKA